MEEKIEAALKIKHILVFTQKSKKKYYNSTLETCKYSHKIYIKEY